MKSRNTGSLEFFNSSFVVLLNQAIALNYSATSRNSAEPQCFLRGCKVDSLSFAASSVKFSIPLLVLFLCASELACACLHMNVCVHARVPMRVNECADTNMETRGQSWLSSLLPSTLLFATESLIDSRVIGFSISAVEQGPGILLFLLLPC